MIRRLSVLILGWLISAGAVAATQNCQFEQIAVGEQKLGPWIDKSNWLAIENQRVSLQASEMFMPAWRLLPSTKAKRAELAANQRQFDATPITDPLDGSQRDLGFLLDSRLYVDGLIVLHKGRIVTERYRNGLLSDRPRLLQEATRPLLNLLGAMSISQGKLAADKSVVRFLPSLTTSTGLRKVSVQRLLDDEKRHAWTSEELDLWRQAAGWTEKPSGNSIRDWLAQPGLWDSDLVKPEMPLFGARPEDDLLAWALTESNATPLAQLFCEQLLTRAQPEHPVLWLSDPQGIALASGLALSLRDFAKLGQLLVEARTSRHRGKIPAWFIEALTASSGARSSEINGLSKGSELRYGFVRLGGKSNRVALIGAHGTSLFVDFDRRMVVALFATHPGQNSPAVLATLEEVWQAIGRSIGK
ncbi:MAG: hypothetical protein PHV02_02265 [Rhodocyclaceae bacterium]|nr:hypothetical protein [Rhodocyclaceae bacterium]